MHIRENFMEMFLVLLSEAERNAFSHLAAICLIECSISFSEQKDI